MSAWPLARLGAVVALLLPLAAQAGSWTVCDYAVVARRVDHAERMLIAALVKAGPRNPAACPPAGGEMRFRPGTADYQSELPRRLWPRVGQPATLRYRFLDGQCKEAGPCRIERHSLARAG